MDSTSRFSRVAAAVLVGFAALIASPGWAATDAEQAEALIREGVTLRAHDSAAQALPLFEKAFQISRTPRTAAQLGLCELELRSFVAAERHLAEALAAPGHPWVAKNKPALKGALDTAHANIGELALTVSPAGAEVSLNHKPVDRALLGAPLRVDGGLVDVEVRAPGYEPAREAVTIAGGKREQRTYVLVREAAKPVAWAGSTITVASPAPDPGAAVTLAAAPPPGPDEVNRKRRTAAWITGGAAVAAVVFGTVEGLNAASKSNAFNDHTGVAGGVTYHDCGTASLSPACTSLKGDYDQALRLSIVGFVAAGALAATSSVLFVLSSPGHGGERDGARALACVPDPVARGLGCSLRF
jgi:tetratricopeptide (TPR) repeat protein